MLHQEYNLENEFNYRGGNPGNGTQRQKHSLLADTQDDALKYRFTLGGNHYSNYFLILFVKRNSLQAPKKILQPKFQEQNFGPNNPPSPTPPRALDYSYSRALNIHHIQVDATSDKQQEICYLPNRSVALSNSFIFQKPAPS